MFMSARRFALPIITKGGDELWRHELDCCCFIERVLETGLELVRCGALQREAHTAKREELVGAGSAR